MFPYGILFGSNGLRGKIGAGDSEVWGVIVEVYIGGRRARPGRMLAECQGRRPCRFSSLLGFGGSRVLFCDIVGWSSGFHGSRIGALESFGQY